MIDTYSLLIQNTRGPMLLDNDLYVVQPVTNQVYLSWLGQQSLIRAY